MNPIVGLLAGLSGGFASGFLGEKAKRQREVEAFKQNMLGKMAPAMLAQGINPFDDPEFAKQTKGTPLADMAPVFQMIAASARNQPEFKAKQALTMEGASPGGTFQVPTNEEQLPAGQAPTQVQIPAQRGTPRSPEAMAAMASANPALAAMAGFGDIARIGMEETRMKRDEERFAKTEARLERSEERAEAREERMAQQWRQSHELAVRQANQQASYQSASLALRRAEIGAAKAERNETNLRIGRSTAGQWAEAGMIRPEEVESTAKYLATGQGKMPASMGQNADLKKFHAQLKAMETEGSKLRDDAGKIRNDVIGSFKSDEPIPTQTAADEIHRANSLLAKDYNTRIAFFERLGNKEAADALRQEAYSQVSVLVQGSGWGGKPMVVSAETAKTMVKDGATLLGRDPNSYIIGGAKGDGSAPTPQEAAGAFRDSYTAKPGGEASQTPSQGEKRYISEHGAPTQAEADAERERKEAAERARLAPRNERLIRSEATKFLKGASPEQVEEYVRLRLGGMPASEARKRFQ